MTKQFDHYPKSNLFRIVDEIFFPHSYGVGHIHQAHADLHYAGNVTEDCITELEKAAGRGLCYMKGCELTLEEHNKALLVDIANDTLPEQTPELPAYLATCVKQMEKEGYAGFAFTPKE